MKQYLPLQVKFSNMQILGVLVPGDLRIYLSVGAVEFEEL